MSFESSSENDSQSVPSSVDVFSSNSSNNKNKSQNSSNTQKNTENSSNPHRKVTILKKNSQKKEPVYENGQEVSPYILAARERAAERRRKDAESLALAEERAKSVTEGVKEKTFANFDYDHSAKGTELMKRDFIRSLSLNDRDRFVAMYNTVKYPLVRLFLEEMLSQASNRLFFDWVSEPPEGTLIETVFESIHHKARVECRRLREHITEQKIHLEEVLDAEAMAVSQLGDPGGIMQEEEQQIIREELDNAIVSANLIKKDIEQSQDFRKILLCTIGTLLGKRVGLYIDPDYNKLERETPAKTQVSNFYTQSPIPIVDSNGVCTGQSFQLRDVSPVSAKVAVIRQSFLNLHGKHGHELLYDHFTTKPTIIHSTPWESVEKKGAPTTKRFEWSFRYHLVTLNDDVMPKTDILNSKVRVVSSIKM